MARPIGKFKISADRPTIGDYVDIFLYSEENSNNLNTITKIYPRVNKFYRPIIANIDSVLIVSSLRKPNFDMYLLLKLIAMFQFSNIKPFIIFNKYDLMDEKERDDFKPYLDFFNNLKYRSLLLDEEKNDLREKLLSNFTSEDFLVITGQSGAGKSTILNKLNENDMENKEVIKP